MVEIGEYKKNFKNHLLTYITLNEVEFRKIFSHFTEKHISRKDYLLRAGQKCIFETYIVSGLFQCCIIDETGKEHTLSFPHEGWWAGDFKSFCRGSKSNMDIVALEDSITLQITKESLESLYVSTPKMERYFRILNENAGISLQDRLVQHFSTNAEQKYKEFRRRYPSLTNRLSYKRIASFLGVTPEYFSLMLKNL